MNSSLVVVGTGIKLISHITTEAKAYIEQSDKVLYLVNEPATKTWIHSINSNAESLDELYTSCELRRDSYLAITNYILKTLEENIHVCVVLYGHPSVYAKPALDAAILAKDEGYFVKILPGISAEDCLFADLLIDPGSHGCLSLEATDALIRKRNIDTTCHVIIWQISVIGMMGHEEHFDNSLGCKLLQEYLNNFYPSDYEMISYTAAQYPGMNPIIIKFKLHQMKTMRFSRTSTLYIPPFFTPECDKKILTELKLM